MKQSVRRIITQEFGYYDLAWWEAHPEEWARFWATYDTEAAAFAELNK